VSVPFVVVVVQVVAELAITSLYQEPAWKYFVGPCVLPGFGIFKEKVEPAVAGGSLMMPVVVSACVVGFHRVAVDNLKLLVGVVAVLIPHQSTVNPSPYRPAHVCPGQFQVPVNVTLTLPVASRWMVPVMLVGVAALAPAVSAVIKMPAVVADASSATALITRQVRAVNLRDPRPCALERRIETVIPCLHPLSRWQCEKSCEARPEPLASASLNPPSLQWPILRSCSSLHHANRKLR
jgi:hypothetical protein